MLNYIVSSLLLPPGLPLVLMLFSLFLSNKYIVFSKVLASFAIVGLYLFSSPFCAGSLATFVEQRPDMINHEGGYNSVVCLTGGLNSNAPEYSDGYAPTANTIVRCNFAASIALKYNLPLVVSGGGFGAIEESKNFEAYFTRLQSRLVIKTEYHSHNTSEAAASIARVFPDLSHKIILVTDAAHMFRAKLIFEKAGIIVSAMPTNYSEFDSFSILSFFPNIRALDSSQRSLHELLGVVFFNLKNYFN